MFVDELRYHIAKSLQEHRIGELLVNKGLINDEQLQAALAESKNSGEKIGQILVRHGHISSFQLYHRIVRQWQLRFGTIALVVLMQMVAPITAYSDNLFSSSHSYEISYNSGKIGASEYYPELFGYREFKSDDLSAFKKWTSAISKYDAQLVANIAPSSKIMLWRDMVDRLQNASARQQIEAVNKFINKSRYIEDNNNYKKADYWATPIEFLYRGGDCEDFAIAKYASLSALGFTPDQMRIAVVHDNVKNMKHAVLIVYIEGKAYVLDNQNKQVEEITQVTRYKPIYSLNSQNWWLHEVA